MATLSYFGTPVITSSFTSDFLITGSLVQVCGCCWKEKLCNGLLDQINHLYDNGNFYNSDSTTPSFIDSNSNSDSVTSSITSNSDSNITSNNSNIPSNSDPDTPSINTSSDSSSDQCFCYPGKLQVTDEELEILCDKIDNDEYLDDSTLSKELESKCIDSCPKCVKYGLPVGIYFNAGILVPSALNGSIITWDFKTAPSIFKFLALTTSGLIPEIIIYVAPTANIKNMPDIQMESSTYYFKDGSRIIIYISRFDRF